MLEQVLFYLNNWFVSYIVSGVFTITDGQFNLSALQNGQYFRIVGSVFNDGVYKYGDELELTDEQFDGAIWALAIPKSVLKIVSDIEAWQDKYGEAAASPYTSESFGGYSYSKTSGYSNSDSATWQLKFADVLAPYRKRKDLSNVTGGEAHQDPYYRKPFNATFPWA